MAGFWCNRRCLIGLCRFCNNFFRSLSPHLPTDPRFADHIPRWPDRSLLVPWLPVADPQPSATQRSQWRAGALTYNRSNAGTAGITVYIEALEARILHQPLTRVREQPVFCAVPLDPPDSRADGKQSLPFGALANGSPSGVRASVAGAPPDDRRRLHWRRPRRNSAGKTLWLPSTSRRQPGLTGAGSQLRAALHLGSREDALRAIDPGGIDVLSPTSTSFFPES